MTAPASGASAAAVLPDSAPVPSAALGPARNDQGYQVGSSSLFDPGVVRIGHAEIRLLLRDEDPARPAPTETFSDRLTLEVGGERIELAWHGANHVRVHQQYMADVAANVRTALGTVDPTPYFQRYGQNTWAAVLASRYPKMAARRERRGVLAVTTSGRSSAILRSKNDSCPRGFDVTAEHTTSGGRDPSAVGLGCCGHPAPGRPPTKPQTTTTKERSFDLELMIFGAGSPCDPAGRDVVGRLCAGDDTRPRFRDPRPMAAQHRRRTVEATPRAGRQRDPTSSPRRRAPSPP